MTQTEVVYSKDVSSINAPGSEGYFGVLPEHAPLITSLKQGKVKIQELDQSEPRFINIQEGFLEVLNNKVDILVDKVEFGTSS